MATSMGRQQLLDVETTCGSMLSELQLIWDEVGEDDEERDQLLLKLEQECLEVYRRMVDQANRSRAHLHQTLADVHSEIVALASALGDRPPMVQQPEKRGSSLKEQLAQLKPVVDDLRRRKEDRLRQFLDIQAQIQRIHSEISASSQITEPCADVTVDEQDLTQRKLDELQGQLQILQKEKNDRLYKILQYVKAVHDLCAVLGWEFFETIRQVHPSLDESFSNQATSISNETLNRLASTIESLREEKKRRMQKLQDLGASLVELWDLMDTPMEEQQEFRHVTCNIAAAEHEVVATGALSLHVIEQAEAEVERLDQLKASRMKELVLKKRTELEEICRRAHMIPDGSDTIDATIASMEAGMVDPGHLLARIEEQIGSMKEEAFSRKEIMEKVEKWMAACEEESWLEDYNKDENRYNATRAAHLNLKRAERARATISKIPALVESLMTTTRAWEEERGKPFLYDGVRLLSTLEDYNILRMEKEEERRRQRVQKRLHEQLVNEQETLFGSRASPTSRTPLKKAVPGSRLNTTNTPASRRLSLGGAMLKEQVPVRLNGMATPARTGAKETNIKLTPASVNRMLMPDHLDSVPSPVFKHASNHQEQEMDATSLSSGARQPLSPVSTPRIRPNANIDDVVSKGITCSPMKAAVNLLKSPLSGMSMGRPAATLMDEENATPQKQTFPQHETVSRSPQISQVSEYSFEERRLAFLFYPSHISAHRGSRDAEMVTTEVVT